jgi:hypothetical protein
MRSKSEQVKAAQAGKEFREGAAWVGIVIIAYVVWSIAFGPPYLSSPPKAEPLPPPSRSVPMNCDMRDEMDRTYARRIDPLTGRPEPRIFGQPSSLCSN